MTNSYVHHKNITFQAFEHPLVDDRNFKTLEEYVLHLMHLKSYKEACEYCRDKDVLDWGCNIGYGMEILAETASSVSGLDLSERACIAARQRLGSKALQIQWYDGTQCDFSDQSFDVVTSFQVLEHISDYNSYFNEIIRVLRPGGLALFTTPNALLRLNPGMKPWNEFHIHEFAPSELMDFLNHRFSSVTIRGLFGTDELYWIERNRVEIAKQHALMTQNSWSLDKPLKRFIKRWFPFTLRIRDAMFNNDSKVLSPSDLARFSTVDLFYRDEDLDEALDLLAICQKSL